MDTHFRRYLNLDLSCSAELNVEKVYRVIVMPCYDKKLEASRNDFASLFGYQVEGHESEINMISEVDLVLRTGEVLELIQKDTFMGSIEALEVMRKQFSDVLLKNILEDKLMTA
ncbi:hypothetical protein JHK85_044112 [Glycine max]|nr:hypothetical protein JHK85_044112 [Glycine max]